MKKIFLHIGPHKTGSTYLQKMFYENRYLLYKNNFCYPEKFISIQWGHNELPKYIKNKKEDILKNFILKIKKSNKNIILSSENFDKLTKEDLNFFKSLLEDYFDVKIVFFKRRLDELLISSWQEKVKHGYTKSWQRFLLDNILFVLFSSLLFLGNFTSVNMGFINTFSLSLSSSSSLSSLSEEER